MNSLTTPDPDRAHALQALNDFRHEWYASLTHRADALFELTDDPAG